MPKDFFERKSGITKKREPLSVRMRPRNLSEYVGQEHILGEGKLLRRAIEADRISSLIFYGPPGCGKTALGHVISITASSYFENINAALSNVNEVRNIIMKAKKQFDLEGKKTILFIDEIHRFNKAQQDVLMPDVEKGNPILVGTTTHNPFFSINSALLSRSQIFEFKLLTTEEITRILESALKDRERGLGKAKVIMNKDAIIFLSKASDGDARRALAALEVGALTTRPNKNKIIEFTLDVAKESIQRKAIIYDKDEDAHYDTSSAFIKSMRGSDPDAALYWLAKMLVAGEDPRFIARRIVICAAEDVGNADPQALLVANAALQISEFVGLPEARIPLAQAVVYIACAPKSNAAYMGISRAMDDVEKERTQEVPTYLKDASYFGAEKLEHGIGYKYTHNFEDHYVKQDYMPNKKKYYIPQAIGYEKKIKEWLKYLTTHSTK
ncbi:MAG: replication-associated recombination protein A [Candidatus Omnitrophica bacterium]|nr:replication-associated recombination protein A [Candidatus Omnitrophota bacterium]